MQPPNKPAHLSDGLLALPGPELVLGLVGAVGCDLEAVSKLLSDSLRAARYSPITIRVSSLLHQLDKYEQLARSAGDSEYKRISDHMTAGTDLRTRSKRGDIMAWLAVFAIRGIRADLGSLTNEHSGPYGLPAPLPRTAFIVRSIKHPAEIQTLRDIYGRAFFVLSAYAPRETRVKELAGLIARSEGDSQASNFRNKAEELIKRDEDERDENNLGQSVRDSFALADVFIDTSSHSGMKAGIARFVEGLFGYPFITPTRDEFGMYHAFAASLRSADLGRQVGAAIASENGEILAVGCNDVPQAGGGQYWYGDKPDHRDFREGFDSSEKFKSAIAGQLVQRLKSAGWTAPGRNAAIGCGDRARTDRQERSSTRNTAAQSFRVWAAGARGDGGNRLRCGSWHKYPWCDALLDYFPLPFVRKTHRRSRHKTRGVHRALSEKSGRRTIWRLASCRSKCASRKESLLRGFCGCCA